MCECQVPVLFQDEGEEEVDETEIPHRLLAKETVFSSCIWLF